MVVALIKKGLHEVPHLMYGGAFFACCWVFFGYEAKRHIKYDMERRHWKKRYTIVREEDFDPATQVHRSERTYPLW